MAPGKDEFKFNTSECSNWQDVTQAGRATSSKLCPVSPFFIIIFEAKFIKE